MSKKILILAGSARKGGNSDVLCDAFMQGAETAGHQVEKLYVTDYTIHYCRGCGVCNTTGRCVQKDDMAGILEKMKSADVIVFATPVYFYSVCGQMKTLIDRTVPQYTQLSDKEFYFIVAAADTDTGAMERTLECFRGFLDCLPNAVEKGVVYGTGAWQIGDIKNKPAVKKAYALGRQA